MTSPWKKAREPNELVVGSAMPGATVPRTSVKFPVRSARVGMVMYCGVLLILLGLWGGLAPFVGPYVHFGFTPDATWHYDSGRLTVDEFEDRLAEVNAARTRGDLDQA